MAGQGLERREILRIMAMGAAAAQFPGFTKWVFACGHSAASLQQIKPTKYNPLFLSGQEYALVERLAELIIPSDGTPGAKEAGAAEFVDYMLAHDRANQYKFRTGLTWLNAHSGKLMGKPFVELSQEQQISLLEPLAYKAKYRVGEEDGQEFFRKVKEMTAMGFYSSKVGYEEIDNPALKFYAASPECPHKDDPEHKHLPPPKW